ncbi:GGDEF domain-containing phosphodiesterase [Methylophaga sp. UBA678]|uniref:putative bifunctional diguanylate cyclase/phosphodiesterase n=1 Tax=Methylophaga sp. UBA678 TaxID=1946901 RepID=UPI00259CB087|nr:GGDEF domain-containing phosphodiesterase [Methylophaga sp. UBA678]
MDTNTVSLLPSEHDEKMALKVDIINMLYSSNLKSVIVASLVAFTLAFVEYDQVNKTILIAWCLIFSVVYGLRLYSTIYFKQHNTNNSNPDTWLNIFRLSTLACGMAWGLAGYYFLSETNDVAHKAFITLVIVGVTGGAMVVYSVDAITSKLFSGSIYLLSLPGFFSNETELSLAMAILLAVYIVYISIASSNLGKKLHENILLHHAAIKQQAEIEKLSQHQRIHLDHTPMGVIEWDLGLQVVSWNAAAEQIFGYQQDEAIHQHARFLLPIDIQDHVIQKMEEFIAEGSSSHCQNENLTKEGDIIFCEWTYTALRDNHNHVVGLATLVQNKTEFKKSQDEIQYLAYYDTLTDLPNRRLLTDRVTQAMHTSSRNQSHCAVFFIDLDNFKNINDLHGHSVGDMLLKSVSTRLKTILRDEDTIARFGGDEFVILIQNIGNTANKSKEISEVIANKIINGISDIYNIGNVQYRTSCSIGICTFQGETLSVNEVFKRADNAMFQAKSDGRSCFRFFDEALQPSIEFKASLENDLRDAVFNRDILPYFQPQVNHRHEPIGAEILLRWQHPKHGMISPAEFIPIAEDSDIINRIGTEVLQHACRQLAVWQQDPATANLVLSVNISARQFMQKNFVDTVLSSIETHQCSGSRLRLEITESLMLKNINELAIKIDKLRSHGITLSLDDFGTGYSSLSILRSFPLDEIKIDKSFVDHMLKNANDAHIIRTVINMSSHMGMTVIAEGVETDAQEAFLAKHGCLNYQGYLFGKPMPMEEFNKYINQHVNVVKT